MEKIFLFLVCCLLITSINCVSAEKLQKAPGNQAGIVNGKGLKVGKMPNDSIKEFSTGQ